MARDTVDRKIISVSSKGQMAVGLVMGIYRMKDMIWYSTEATNGEAA